MTREPKEPATAETPAEGESYARQYYLKTRKDRLKAHREKWNTDPEFRKTALDKARAERATVRAAKAHDKFQAMIEKAHKDENAKQRKQKRPRRQPYGLRKVSFSGRAEDLVEVYPSGSFATAIGRKQETIADWLKNKTLPGASIFLGGKSYYTQSFIGAVYRACEQLYFRDGNGSLEILGWLIRRELALASESFVPPGKTDRVRLRASDFPLESLESKS